MANTEFTSESTTASLPVHYPPLLARYRLQEINPNLLQQTTLPRRTEVSELLHRHYEDKSFIDTWTSWSYELSFWQKASLSLSVISIAGLSGALLGLAAPFIAIASGLLYTALTVLNEHEQHRRDRGARLAEENTILANQLDQMMNQFRQMATDVMTALEQVKTQAVEMSEHNVEISQRTEEHAHEQARLQEIITAVEYTEKVRNDVFSIAQEITSGLQSVPAQIDAATCAVHDFKNTINRIKETTALIDQTEAKLVIVSDRLQEHVEHTKQVISQQAAPAEPEFDNTILASQNRLAIMRALRKKWEQHNAEQSYPILII